MDARKRVRGSLESIDRSISSFPPFVFSIYSISTFFHFSCCFIFSILIIIVAVIVFVVAVLFIIRFIEINFKKTTQKEREKGEKERKRIRGRYLRGCKKIELNRGQI